MYGQTKDKPSILDQIETVVVEFLTTNNLGFESEEKKKATKALAISVRLFNFMHADMKAISQNESSKFNTPILEVINTRSLQKQSLLSRGT